MSGPEPLSKDDQNGQNFDRLVAIFDNGSQQDVCIMLLKHAVWRAQRVLFKEANGRADVEQLALDAVFYVIQVAAKGDLKSTNQQGVFSFLNNVIPSKVKNLARGNRRYQLFLERYSEEKLKKGESSSFESELKIVEVLEHVSCHLGKKHREALTMVFEGFSQNEIARRLGVSCRTVRRLIVDATIEVRRIGVK